MHRLSFKWFSGLVQSGGDYLVDSIYIVDLRWNERYVNPANLFKMIENFNFWSAKRPGVPFLCLPIGVTIVDFSEWPSLFRRIFILRQRKLKREVLRWKDFSQITIDQANAALGGYEWSMNSDFEYSTGIPVV